MKYILLIFALLGISLPGAMFAAEQQKKDEVTTKIDNRLVPYEEVSFDSEGLKKIWIDPNGDDSWWHREDETRSAYIATFKNDLGQIVQISQWIDHYACSPTECPVRVFVDGIKVFDDRICVDQTAHNLTRNHNSVFLCDFVIPLRNKDTEETK